MCAPHHLNAAQGWPKPRHPCDHSSFDVRGCFQRYRLHDHTFTLSLSKGRRVNRTARQSGLSQHPKSVRAELVEVRTDFTGIAKVLQRAAVRLLSSLLQSLQVCYEVCGFLRSERLRCHESTALDRLRIRDPEPQVPRRVLKVACQGWAFHPISNAVQGRAGAAAFTADLVAGSASLAREERLALSSAALVENPRRYSRQRLGGSARTTIRDGLSSRLLRRIPRKTAGKCSKQQSDERWARSDLEKPTHRLRFPEIAAKNPDARNQAA